MYATSASFLFLGERIYKKGNTEQVFFNDFWVVVEETKKLFQETQKKLK